MNTDDKIVSILGEAIVKIQEARIMKSINLCINDESNMYCCEITDHFPDIFDLSSGTKATDLFHSKSAAVAKAIFDVVITEIENMEIISKRNSGYLENLQGEKE